MKNKEEIAITGHTLGLGKAIFEHFRERSIPIEGFSRSNGFDLSDSHGQSKLFNHLLNKSIFINNVHAGWSQVDLLYKVFELWKNQEKTIINIGSLSSDGNKDFSHRYAVEKSALEKAVAQLNNIKDIRCKITIIKPGWIKNERTSKMNIKEPMLNMSHVIDLIEFILSLPADVHIPHVSLCRLKEFKNISDKN
jgi:NADP-dependent 3-hydroxy acid dehydrogenase YdfG